MYDRKEEGKTLDAERDRKEGRTGEWGYQRGLGCQGGCHYIAVPLPGTFTASYTSHAAINAQRYNLSPVKITRQRWLEELREGGRD